MITSTANKTVKQIVQWQEKARERKKEGIFLAEGRKMFEEAPKHWIREVYVSCGALEKIKEKQDLSNASVLEKLQRVGYEIVTDEVFAKMSDTRSPQGILTVLKRPQYKPEDLFEEKAGLYIVLEHLQDPGNLGTILRTAEGAGVTGVIMTTQTVDLFNPKTIRSTMGSIYRVPFVYTDDLPGLIGQMREKGIRTYAAHLAGTTYYDSVSFREPTAFLIGNEGNGLTQETAALADAYIKIPMEGSVESLNAAVATALLVYEAHRQRNCSKTE